MENLYAMHKSIDLLCADIFKQPRFPNVISNLILSWFDSCADSDRNRFPVLSLSFFGPSKWDQYGFILWKEKLRCCLGISLKTICEFSKRVCWWCKFPVHIRMTASGSKKWVEVTLIYTKMALAMFITVYKLKPQEESYV